MTFDGYTGKLWEEEIIGHCTHIVMKYTSYENSMNIVKKSQPWDTTDPQPRFANNLHANVAMALGIEDWSQLQFYTAVGSPLDYFHGIDCFFEFQGHVVTIDVTTNPDKDEYRADFILQRDTDEQEIFCKEVANALQGV